MNSVFVEKDTQGRRVVWFGQIAALWYPRAPPLS